MTFDQPISLRKFYAMDDPTATVGVYDFAKGAASGFVLWATANGTSQPAWGQPAVITGMADACVGGWCWSSRTATTTTTTRVCGVAAGE